MIGLLQRVSSAKVQVDSHPVAAIGPGLLVLVGVRPDDDRTSAMRLLARLLRYRVFADGAGKMNLSLTQVGGALLLVPQFTLAADTSKGLRPGFSNAAPPEQGRHCSITWYRRPANSMAACKAGCSALTCRCRSPTTDLSPFGWTASATKPQMRPNAH
jgi:D-aminoacyl-tRNA deacylase